LRFGDRLFNRLKNHLGKVGIEFANLFRLRNEVLERRLRIFGLDLNHGVERLGTQQFFDESKALIQIRFGIVRRFTSDGEYITS